MSTIVTGVDFVSVPTTDLDRAVAFYGETLGLKRNELAHEEWPEFETGNVTILLNTPEQTGVPFSPSNTAIALRVPDVAAAMAKLRDAGVEFPHERMIGIGPAPTKLSCPGTSSVPSTGRPAGLGRSSTQTSLPCRAASSSR